jgi:hypothetical protein
VNVVRPGADVTEIEPSWRSTTIWRAVESPRPVPAPTLLVVKNGSKMRGASSSGMPGPSSAISTIAQPSSERVAIVSVPLPASASSALSIRFV